MVGGFAGVFEFAEVGVFLGGEEIPLGHVPVEPEIESRGVDSPLGGGEDL